MPWTGPILLRDYLDRPGGAQGGRPDELPPETPGVYVLSERFWTGEPDKTSRPWYVGASGNRNPQGRSGLRGRIGNLISSLCGFYGDIAGLHCGGITVSEQYCLGNPPRSPLSLWIAWRPMPNATPREVAKEERRLIEMLDPPGNHM